MTNTSENMADVARRLDSHDVGYISGYINGYLEASGASHQSRCWAAVADWLRDNPAATADNLKEALFDILDKVEIVEIRRELDRKLIDEL